MRPPSLLSLLRPEAGRVAAGALCLGATNALGFAIPSLLERAIDALAEGRPQALAVATRAALLIVVAAAAAALIRTASRILMFNSGRNVEYRLRRDIFAHLARQPPSFYQSHATGDLMSRLTSDLGAVRMLFGPAILNLVNTAIVYATGIFLMWSSNPRLTVFALLPLPLVVLFGRISSRTLYSTSRALQEELGRLSTAIQEDLAGVQVVRTYVMEEVRRQRFAALNAVYFRGSLALVRARGLLMPIFAGITGVGTLVVLWMGGKEVIAGRMTVGELVAFNAYFAYLSFPTVALGWILSLWGRGVAAWSRVRAFAVVPTTAEEEVVPPTDPTLEVRGLTVTRGGRRVLDGVSFVVPAGRTLAVVGATGSGKSSLADALLRFVDVPAGTIFLGGQDITAVPARAVRAAIGYAPQEPFLFSASVADNIAFGRSGGEVPLDDAAVRQAAETAGLARDVAALPDGYATVVGERGITLSGGQRQRVALARALHAGPRVLVLDDCLSSVDAETEREIVARLRPALAGRTAIVISHRVSAVRDADEVLVLDQGRVVERGTPAALAEAGGPFASLYREQLAGGQP